MNEAETRAEHIDPALRTAGWACRRQPRQARGRDHAGTHLRTGPARQGAHGRLRDYVLESRNTKLAVIEAKAWGLALTEGVAQAKTYAGKLAVRFAYATNGQGIYSVDMQTGTEGEAATYPTPDELWALTFAETDVCGRRQAVRRTR